MFLSFLKIEVEKISLGVKMENFCYPQVTISQERTIDHVIFAGQILDWSDTLN